VSTQPWWLTGREADILLAALRAFRDRVSPPAKLEWEALVRRFERGDRRPVAVAIGAVIPKTHKRGCRWWGWRTPRYPWQRMCCEESPDAPESTGGDV